MNPVPAACSEDMLITFKGFYGFIALAAFILLGTGVLWVMAGIAKISGNPNQQGQEQKPE